MREVDSIRQEIRDQRVVVGDRLEELVRRARGEVESIRERLDVRARLRERMVERPLPFLAGGVVVGYALGATAPAAVRLLATATLVGARLLLRVGGPVAVAALIAQERRRRRATFAAGGVARMRAVAVRPDRRPAVPERSIAPERPIPAP